MTFKNFTKYFRQSLIDSDRLSPSDKDILPIVGVGKIKQTENYISVGKECWVEGLIHTSIAKFIIDIASKKADKDLMSAEVLLIPRIDLLVSIGGRRNQNARKILLPILVIAKVDVEGKLSPSDKAPWIPREWLSPSQTSDITITDIHVVDQFVSKNPFTGVDTWSSLVEYCESMLLHALGKNTSSSEHEAKPGLYDVSIDEGLVQADDFLIQVEAPISGAKDKILKVYDDLLTKRSPPSLYRRFIAGNFEASEFKDKTNSLENAKAHIGQMTGEFPLTDKQRNALHYHLETKKGEILAINGPPGTGKTTLLRSVVADLWTNAALKQTEPPIIFAASNNNQAVTNILESFAKIDEKGIDESLSGRWLPEISSYGLYCCSRSSKTKDNYHYFAGKDDSSMLDWQNREFLEKATEFFQQKAGIWKPGISKNISEIKKTIHDELTSAKRFFDLGFKLYETYSAITKQFIEIYGTKDSLTNQINEHESKLATLTSERENRKEQFDQFLASWDQRSIWISLFMWLPPVKKSQYRKNQRLALTQELELDRYDDESIESFFNKNLRQLDRDSKSTKVSLLEFERHIREWESSEEKILHWLSNASSNKNTQRPIYDRLIAICDTVLRFKMFKLATHYWEAAWLEDVKSYLDKNENENNSPRKIPLRFRRYAKITPCMVSTFYMLPSMMTASEMTDGVWRNIPLYESIDLLIVDEAGQALPEVSAASFAFAKRALIVGDTDQIEPVWSVPMGVDRSNLLAFNLLETEEQFDNFWIKSGLMASCGNVMAVAQRQTAYHQLSQLQRGLYLTEHYRCFDDIIGYCNDLVYEGELEAKRGTPESPSPWGKMSFINHSNPSSKHGGSRANEGEAQLIANWLVSNYQKIIDYARQQDGKLLSESDEFVFKKSIGVVTPFSSQANFISQNIRAAKLPAVTVGTVHALQGDEKLIVLFSSVYGANDKGTGKFYDMKPNMLNVAVSRAKDCFIVFGDSEVFGVDVPGSPSGLLRSRLREIS